MSAPEFSRPVRARPAPPERLAIAADAAECAALAKRFGVTAIVSLSAQATFAPEDAAIAATVTLVADLVQTCAVSLEDIAVHIEDRLTLRFVPAGSQACSDEERELSQVELDEVEYEGDTFDLGEAVAQSLGLAIDPYSEGPGADAARRAAGLGDDSQPTGPLAEALAKLKR